MDYNLFIKNKFLNTTLGDFSRDFDKTNYNGFEKIVTKNTHFGLGKIALKVCRKNVKSVFDQVDGMPINQNNTIITRKDGYVDKDEMFQLVKDSYESVKGEKISENDLKNMTIKQAIDLVIKYWNKKEK